MNWSDDFIPNKIFVYPLKIVSQSLFISPLKIPFNFLCAAMLFVHTLVSNVLLNFMAKQNGILTHALLNTEYYQLVLASQYLTHPILIFVVVS